MITKTTVADIKILGTGNIGSGRSLDSKRQNEQIESV